MIQQVNLYQPQTKKALHLSFWFALKMGAGLAVFLLLVSLYETYQHIKTIRTLQALENEYTQVLAALEKIKAKVPGPEVKETYIKQIQKLQAEQKTKKEMLSVLTDLQATQTQGFSRYLSALAAQASTGIWLTHFNFDQNKNEISLKGTSTRPDNVPRLIDKLGQEPVFSGRTFQVFKLAIDASTSYINFELSTEDEKKTDQSK